MAGKTLTEQCGVATDAWTADAQGMHAHIPFDMVRYANNLATYCNNHTHFFFGSLGPIQMSSTVAREIFMCQVPIAVPLWAAKLRWTAGVSCTTGTLTAASIYISPNVYSGVGGDGTVNQGAFDTLNLKYGYVTRSVSVSVSAGEYELADDSGTGIYPLDQSVVHRVSAGSKLVTNLIVTLTTGSANTAAELHDFTCWFTP